MRKDDQVVIIGLGYVGLTLAVSLADSGFNVHGVEKNPRIRSELVYDRATFLENGLNDLIFKLKKNGKFTFSDEIPISKNKRFFIITVGTPIDSAFKPDLNSISIAASEISKTINDGDFVILRSTVKIGTTNAIVKTILDSSGKRYGLAFCPERSVEGNALKEIKSIPQIIGANNLLDQQIASDFFETIVNRIVKVSSIETAEMIKLVDNMQRDVHFAISNEVAMICNKTRLNASEVILKGKDGYSRTNLSLPGPVGGPCLEKDTYILNDKLEIQNSVSLTARRLNELIVIEVVDYIKNHFNIVNRDSNFVLKISIVGLAFKGTPPTGDVRGSVAIKLSKLLKKSIPNCNIYAFDPLINPIDVESLDIELKNEFDSLFEQRDLVIFMNKDSTLDEIDVLSKSFKMNRGGLIYDFWGRLENKIESSNRIKSVNWGSHYFDVQLD